MAADAGGMLGHAATGVLSFIKGRDAHLLADIFIREYAPSRSEKNRLDQFEGFIYEGPEYLTMFAGDGKELQTIRFPVGRQDDGGLSGGSYTMPRMGTLQPGGQIPVRRGLSGRGTSVFNRLPGILYQDNGSCV